MSSRLQELGARRRRLVAQSDALRAQLSGSTLALEQILGFADLGVSAGRYVKGKPVLLLLGIGAALLVVKPRRALRGISFALTALSIFSQVRRALSARR